MEKLYPDELKLTEHLPGGRQYIIPIPYLRGRQRREEYSQGKMRSAIKEIRKGGILYLMDNPIVLCYLETSQEGHFIIVDGHHRVRAAANGKMTGNRITKIPSLIYSLGELVPVFEQILHKPFNEETLQQRFEDQTAEALASFHFLPDTRIPRLTIPPGQDINNLPFPTFAN